MSTRIATQYAVFLERYDLAEDSTADDIIAAIEAEAASRRKRVRRRSTSVG